MLGDEAGIGTGGETVEGDGVFYDRPVGRGDIGGLDAADGGEQAMPARGYEFREGDRAIAALQYYGGGYPTSKKHLVVFLRNDLDPRAKLLLAAAMAAILQSKVNATLN